LRPEEDLRKGSPAEIGLQREEVLIEVVPQSPLFQENLEMQAQHRTMVEISKMWGGNPTQKEEREAKKKSFMDNFVSEKLKAAYGFCCWARPLEDKRSKSTTAIEDLKQAPVGNSLASLPVHQPPATGVPPTARVTVVQTPRQNMEDVSDLTLDDSKQAATDTVHNNESKVPKREPRTGPKRQGNDGMNAWWMGLATGAKQNCFSCCRRKNFEKTTPPSWNAAPRWSKETTSFLITTSSPCIQISHCVGICDQKSQHRICWETSTRGWQSKIYRSV
jgi:hypothetical protein